MPASQKPGRELLHCFGTAWVYVVYVFVLVGITSEHNALLFALLVQDFLSRTKNLFDAGFIKPGDQNMFTHWFRQTLCHTQRLGHNSSNNSQRLARGLNQSPLSFTSGNHRDQCSLVCCHRHFLVFSFPVTGGQRSVSRAQALEAQSAHSVYL